MRFFSTVLFVATLGVGVGCSSADHSVGTNDASSLAAEKNGGPSSATSDSGAESLSPDGGGSSGVLCNGTPNPAGCSEQNPCTGGKVCVPPDGSTCLPTGCACESESKNWTCTPDCMGHVCVDPPVTTCNGVANPAGCSNENPCPTGKQCVENTSDKCIASGCTCDTGTNSWSCTPDCSGRVCL